MLEENLKNRLVASRLQAGDPHRVSLPKWPGLLVVGVNVTPPQAYEIIIKTDQNIHYPEDLTNNSDFNTSLMRLFNIPTHADRQSVLSREGSFPHPLNEQKLEIEQKRLDKSEKLKKDLGIIDLQYLSNSRIGSCWIGGSNGWIDSDGHVFCANQNIGKWPTVAEVLSDWALIAKQFPYLTLVSQLLSGEICCEDTHPLVEFVVSSGEVTAFACGSGHPKISEPASQTDNDLMDALNSSSFGVGITAERLRDMLICVYGSEYPQYDRAYFDHCLYESRVLLDAGKKRKT